MTSKDLLLRCDSLYEALDRFLDKEQSFLERMMSRGHLWMCPSWRAYLEQYRKVREITDQPSQADLPDDFAEVMQRVVGEWRQDPDS